MSYPKTSNKYLFEGSENLQMQAKIKLHKENPQLDNFLIALDEIEFESALERANTEKHNLSLIHI
jgi:hypothetical protein